MDEPSEKRLPGQAEPTGNETAGERQFSEAERKEFWRQARKLREETRGLGGTDSTEIVRQFRDGELEYD